MSSQSIEGGSFETMCYVYNYQQEQGWIDRAQNGVSLEITPM